MIGSIGGVTEVQEIGTIEGDVYSSPLIPAIDTNAIGIDAASLGLPRAVGTTVAEGSYLNAATAHEPVCVLGAAAAERLGIDRVFASERIWAGNMWCYVAGIPEPGRARPRDRLLGPGWVPRRRELPGLRRESLDHLRSRSDEPGQRGLQPPRRDS